MAKCVCVLVTSSVRRLLQNTVRNGEKNKQSLSPRQIKTTAALVLLRMIKSELQSIKQKLHTSLEC